MSTDRLHEEIATLWERRSWAALTDDWAGLAAIEQRLDELGALWAEPAGEVPADAVDHVVGEDVDPHMAPNWW